MVGNTVTIPVEEHNVSALRVLDGDLLHTVLRDIGVVAVTTDGIDLASHVETHADEGHAPPDVFGRTGKPRLVHTLSEPSTGLGTRLGHSNRGGKWRATKRRRSYSYVTSLRKSLGLGLHAGQALQEPVRQQEYQSSSTPCSSPTGLVHGRTLSR